MAWASVPATFLPTTDQETTWGFSMQLNATTPTGPPLLVAHCGSARSLGERSGRRLEQRCKS